MDIAPLAYAWSPTYLIIILIVVVLLFGGTKIPELMRGVGKGMGEFKKGVREGKDPADDEEDDEVERLRARRLALEAEKQKLAEAEAELKALKSREAE